jgi:hypothetical protein
MQDALSDDRTGLYFPVNIMHWSESRKARNHLLLSHLRLPQPGRPSPDMYTPQGQRGQVIPPVTGFPFRRHLLYAGLRWR